MRLRTAIQTVYSSLCFKLPHSCTQLHTATTLRGTRRRKQQFVTTWRLRPTAPLTAPARPLKSAHTHTCAHSKAQLARVHRSAGRSTDPPCCRKDDEISLMVISSVVCVGHTSCWVRRLGYSLLHTPSLLATQQNMHGPDSCDLHVAVYMYQLHLHCSLQSSCSCSVCSRASSRPEASRAQSEARPSDTGYRYQFQHYH